jgi:hypothetical protein
MINPTRTVPAVIDNVVATPVKVHAQPVSDRETETEYNERWAARNSFFDVHGHGIVLGDVNILGHSRIDPDIVPFDNDALFTVTNQIADCPRPPPEALDRIGHVFRLVHESVSQVGGPIHIRSHHL